MDHQWQTYGDSSASRPTQFGNGFGAQQSQAAHKHMTSQSQQPQAPLGYSYEPYQASDTVPAAPTSNAPTKSISMTSSPSETPLTRQYLPDVDATMEDADPYNSSKYASARPSHHHRASSQFLASEESSASRRYSPMNTQTPSQPYNPSPSASQNPYAFGSSGQASSRPSPTRSSTLSSLPQTYQSPPCAYFLFCVSRTPDVLCRVLIMRFHF